MSTTARAQRRPGFKAGDPAPAGYIAWHEWARVQHRAGLRQSRCAGCGLWRFPQEKCCRHTPRAQSSKAKARRKK